MAKQTKQVLGIVLALLMATPSHALECSTSDIKKNTDGTYTYSKDCHTRVGQLVEESELRKDQVDKLNLSIGFYKTAYEIQQERAKDWMNTSIQLDKELQRQRTFSDLQKVGYFVLGVLVTVGAARALK